MAQLHSLAAVVANATAFVTMVVALAMWGGRWASRRVVDRAILVLLAAVGAAALVGVVLPIVGPPPSDPLHFLYAVVALVAAPLSRYMAREGDDRQIGRYVAFGALVTLGALLRLFMTGR